MSFGTEDLYAKKKDLKKLTREEANYVHMDMENTVQKIVQMFGSRGDAFLYTVGMALQHRFRPKQETMPTGSQE